MTSPLDQIDDDVDRRIRAGYTRLRAEVAASVDVDSALSAIAETRHRGASRRLMAVAAFAAAAAAVVAIGVALASSSGDLAVTTPRVGPASPSGTGRGPRTSVPATYMDGTPIVPTTISQFVGTMPTLPPTTTTPAEPYPGDTEPLIVGGRILDPGSSRDVQMLSRDPGSNPVRGSRSPDGSGCSPGGSSLPDGTWFGYLGVDGTGLTLDVACRYTNDAADWALGHYEHKTDDDGSMEWYVRNASTTTRPIPVDQRTSFTDLASYSTMTFQEVNLDQIRQRIELLASYPTRLFAWVRIVGGRAEWVDVPADMYAG